MNQNPSVCFAFLPENGPGKYIVAITYGERGYNPSSYDEADPDKAKALVDLINRTALHVNKRQAEAMLVGSMFGWDVPGAKMPTEEENFSAWLLEEIEKRQILDVVVKNKAYSMAQDMSIVRDLLNMNIALAAELVCKLAREM
jgi:hypothetical protein